MDKKHWTIILVAELQFGRNSLFRVNNVIFFFKSLLVRETQIMGDLELVVSE